MFKYKEKKGNSIESSGIDVGILEIYTVLIDITSGIKYFKQIDVLNYSKIEYKIRDHIACLLRNPYADQVKLEMHMEQRTGSKLGKGTSRLCVVTLLI